VAGYKALGFQRHGFAWQKASTWRMTITMSPTCCGTLAHVHPRALPPRPRAGWRARLRSSGPALASHELLHRIASWGKSHDERGKDEWRKRDLYRAVWRLGLIMQCRSLPMPILDDHAVAMG